MFNIRPIGLLLLLILFSCRPERINVDSKSHELEVKPLTSVVTQLNKNKSEYVFQNDSFLYLLSLHDGYIAVTNIYTDSIERLVRISDTLKKVHSISVYDTANFAIYADQSFYVYQNSTFVKYPIEIFGDGLIPYPYMDILYLQDKKKIIAGSLVPLQPGQTGYDNQFLNIYNLETLKSELASLCYPNKYHGNKLGIPKGYLSRSGDIITVSFQFDDSVYMVNVNDITNYASFELNVHDGNKDIIEIDDSISKHEKLDILLHNTNSSKYGMAFYDSQRKELYRFYSPSFPVEEDNGIFLSSINVRCWLLRTRINSDTVSKYILPSGVFFVPQLWTANFRTQPIFIYNKIIKNAKNEEVWTYLPYIIKPNNF